jgi:hypothetical protein
VNAFHIVKIWRGVGYLAAAGCNKRIGCAVKIRIEQQTLLEVICIVTRLIHIFTGVCLAYKELLSKVVFRRLNQAAT